MITAILIVLSIYLLISRWQFHTKLRILENAIDENIATINEWKTESNRLRKILDTHKIDYKKIYCDIHKE